MPANFVHLRLHTAYSLAESTLRIKNLSRLVAEDHQPAAAITDTNNMFGALEFSQAMANVGVQPIMGAQLNITDSQGAGEVVLLAQNETGYVNLSHLLSDALLNSEAATDPQSSLDALTLRGEGLILLSGGVMNGFVGLPASDGRPALAKARLQALNSIMPGRVYIELQRHGMGAQQVAEPILLELADQLDMPLVATNDCRFDAPKMAEPHDALVCIGTGRKISEENRVKYSSNHYFKSAKQMTDLFIDIPEAIANSVIIAKRCSYMSPERAPILPAFTAGTDTTEDMELARQAENGLAQRLARHVYNEQMDANAKAEAAKPYQDRLAFELGIINQMGFPGYFLIVADFIQWAKNAGIPVGPGRGSGAGSVVAWALSITDLDPLRWGLLFERFLNPERVSMPDFDIDFCQDRRDEVITYVQEKYGKDRVAQIITFGSLQARAALRDVGRVLEMPYGQVDRIAKLIPNNPANPTTIAQALESEADLRAERNQDEQVADLIDMSLSLEGLYRHASTHAAGLVIGDRPLADLVPLYRDPRSEMPVTQFNMKWVEKAGLVKFDFLGLKTLTVLQRAVEFIAQRGITIDLESIPLDDTKTFEMLSVGDTVGVFQLESAGMRDVLRGLKPDRFEDIIAVVALYRPGPMENIPDYVARKHDPSQITYMHPDLEPVLKETYGIMIYQEQVQQAAQVLAGYTLGAADILRRAMGKKIKAEMDAQRATFVDGAVQNNISEKLASDIFDTIAAFAGYGFNKSHAAAYALVSYQTAYLKANYPVEFLAASMALDAGNTEKLAVFRQECQQKGITIKPPCVNHSFAGFRVEADTDSAQATSDHKLVIRYALGAIKNVGAEAMSRLTEKRDAGAKFENMMDFLERLPRDASNRRQMENLVRAGALDCLHDNRKELLNNIDYLLAHAETLRRDKESNQNNLFGEDTDSMASSLRLTPCDDWVAMDRLKEEFDALGLYLSAHPLDGYGNQLEKLRIITATELNRQIEAGRPPQRVNLAGSITGKQVRVSQRGNKFAFVQFTDQTGVFETTFFSDVLSESSELLNDDKPLLVSANLKIEENGPRLLAARVQLLDDAVAAWHGGVGLWIRDDKPLEQLKSALRDDGPGKAEVKLHFTVDGHDVRVALAGRFKLSGELRQNLRRIPGILEVREL
ncbi:DNA polymerase III subunit alpha [Alphaproteobacteria bacterium]|nr:DNA polymerase III subunit alpha [Alphaproteobacteria bacterium]